MNPQDPLANLHPLREPAMIDWWPLAPGWWLLLVLALLCLVALGYFLRRRYRANAYRRRALIQLRELQRQYNADRDDTAYIAHINALLKSVALVTYPRREVAANSGAKWLEFLNGSLGGGDTFQDVFATAAYQRECPALDMEQVHNTARTWIKRHEVAR